MSRFVLITGAARGLGLFVTKAHLELGDRVYALARKVSQPLQELIDQYPSLTVKLCDLGCETAVADALADLTASGEKLDILYNIAGLFFEDDRVPLEETDLDRCMMLFNINALGCLRVLKYAIPALGEGTLVLNVSSESGSIADCQRSAEYGYGMSKAALNIASKLLSNQISCKGVRILCYHPGWMRTDMGGDGAKQSEFALDPDEAARRIMDIALDPQQIPADVMFVDYQKKQLPW